MRRPPGHLTPRQREVARLVAEGMTDREIAALLVVSRRTVEAHVRDVLAALNVPNRRAIIRLAAQAAVYGVAIGELFGGVVV